VLHLTIGAAALLEADFTYLGTLIPPPNGQHLAQIADPGIMSGREVSYGAVGSQTGAYYFEGVLYGLARFRQSGALTSQVALFTTRYELALLRLPEYEGAAVTLVGGGGPGEVLFIYSSLTSGNTTIRQPATGTVQRTEATATQALGLAVAAGAAYGVAPESVSAPPEIITINAGETPPVGVSRAAGAAGVELAGVTVGGGSSVHHAWQGTLSTAVILMGGFAGSVRRVEALPGALLALAVGRGGQIAVIVQDYGGGIWRKQVISCGQDGGALVEWEEWA
jgi:hypothetical protein